MRTIPFALACLCAVLTVWWVRPAYLTVRDSHGRIAAAFPTGRELRFSIRYIHSVALLPCTDFLAALPDGSIRVDATTYSGLGAGLPFTEEGAEFSLENGSITLEGLGRIVPEIAILPSPLYSHTISVGSRTFELRALIGEKGVGRLKVERLPALTFPGHIGTGYSTYTRRESRD